VIKCFTVFPSDSGVGIGERSHLSAQTETGTATRTFDIADYTFIATYWPRRIYVHCISLPQKPVAIQLYAVVRNVLLPSLHLTAMLSRVKTTHPHILQKFPGNRLCSCFPKNQGCHIFFPLNLLTSGFTEKAIAMQRMNMPKI
jgi:hypothetical protein